MAIFVPYNVDGPAAGPEERPQPPGSDECVFSLDFSVMTAQIEALAASLAAEGLHGLGEELLLKFEHFGADFAFGEGTPTVLADGSNGLVLTPRLGQRYDRLLAALRTGERELVLQTLASFAADDQHTAPLVPTAMTVSEEA